VRHRRVQGEADQEWHHRGARGVHRTALVVDRRVEIVESIDAGLRVGHRREPARHVIRRAVRVLQRRPVDLGNPVQQPGHAA
jgi:hypothetical protein